MDSSAPELDQAIDDLVKAAEGFGYHAAKGNLQSAARARSLLERYKNNLKRAVQMEAERRFAAGLELGR